MHLECDAILNPKFVEYTTNLTVSLLKLSLLKQYFFTSNHKKTAFKRRNDSFNHFYFLSLNGEASFVA